jgi:alpha-tubulin suppressor-like RCC1 family protein
MTFLTNNQLLANRYFSTASFSANNALYAWGNNSIGQLGQGNTTNYSSPVQVGAVNYWTQVSCGYNYYSIGIQSPGTLWSWGSNSYGQLGVNTGGTNNTSSPVQIPFPVFQGWSEVAINAWGDNVYALAIQSNGTLWAWGNNTFGQLGLGDITNRSSPVQVGTSSNWIAVTTAQGGTPFSLAVQSTGTLWSWGSNNNGALGLNSSPGSVRVSTPVQIGTASTWSKISAGNAHWLGIQNNGTLWGCGYNVFGQLGNNSNIQVSSPIQIGASLWSQISAGSNNGSMGIQSNGSLWGWGTGNGLYLGLNTSAAPSSPVQVGALTSWVQINFYGSGGSAIQSNGTLWAWGFNFNGQLGLNDTATRSSPVQVGSLSVWARIACGYSTIAVQSNGTLWSWGSNSNGMLGLNTSTASYSSPVQVGTLSNWLKPFVSQYNAYRSAAINNTGRLFISGQSGLSTIGDTSSPVQLVGPLVSLYSVSNWTRVASGNAHWLAVQSPGTLWSCGYNGYGQLGNNTSSTSVGASTPVQIGALTTWTQTAGGNFSSYALQNTGTLWAWGYNAQGQLGQNNTANLSSPTQVGALSNWTQISVNSTSATALALQSNGTLWAWGYNAFGQIGNSNTTNLSSPVQIGALTLWTKIASGGYSSYAIQSNGTLWSWGLNSQGQLGLNTTVGVSSPVQIGTASTWIQVGAGSLQLAAIQNNGTLWMCGYNSQGQIGNNSTTNISVLTQVGSLNKWNFATGARQILAQQIP